MKRERRRCLQVQEFYNLSRPLVYMNMILAGAQYRGPKNQYAALNYHVYAACSQGNIRRFAVGEPADSSISRPVCIRIGRSRSWRLGGSVDFNLTKNWAIRLSPDLILEHFGNETREFVAVSGGVIYRFGKNKK